MSLPDEYRDLVVGYLQSLEQTCQDIERWAEELERNGSQDALLRLRAVAHKLAGNGASFGFPEITESAKAVTAAARAHAEGPSEGLRQVAAAARRLVGTCTAARAEFTGHR